MQHTGFRCADFRMLMLIVLFVGVFVAAAIPSYLAPLRHGVAWPFALGQAVLSGLVADLVVLVILVAAVKIFVKVTGLPS